MATMKYSLPCLEMFCTYLQVTDKLKKTTIMSSNHFFLLRKVRLNYANQNGFSLQGNVILFNYWHTSTSIQYLSSKGIHAAIFHEQNHAREEKIQSIPFKFSHQLSYPPINQKRDERTSSSPIISSGYIAPRHRDWPLAFGWLRREKSPLRRYLWTYPPSCGQGKKNGWLIYSSAILPSWLPAAWSEVWSGLKRRDERGTPSFFSIIFSSSSSSFLSLKFFCPSLAQYRCSLNQQGNFSFFPSSQRQFSRTEREGNDFFPVTMPA